MEKQKSTESKQLQSDIQLYEKILELRKFEIENFWKRALFFWGIIAIIYAGYFSMKSEDYPIIIALVGFLFNVIFSLSIRGSKYWQENWETRASEYEKENHFVLFEKNKVEYEERHFFTIPYRFSVSKLTMLLSDLSTLLWLSLWIKEIIFFCKKVCESIHNSTSLLEPVFLILVQFILIIYFSLFFKYGKVKKDQWKHSKRKS